MSYWKIAFLIVLAFAIVWRAIAEYKIYRVEQRRRAVLTPTERAQEDDANWLSDQW